MTGAIVDSGTIKATSHGILIDSASKVHSTTTAVVVAGRTFTGGIDNTGTISAAHLDGIQLAALTFTGGLSNGGAILVPTALPRHSRRGRWLALLGRD